MIEFFLEIARSLQANPIHPVESNLTGMVKKSPHRLTFLIVESEPQQGLSTRKLLIETAKHNVLTAYSPHEGLETLRRFPYVDCIVFDMSSENMRSEEH